MAPDASTDPVAAYLAAARKNWEAFGDGSATPRLLGALEAVLGVHKPGDGRAEIHTLDKGWHLVTACAGLRGTVAVQRLSGHLSHPARGGEWVMAEPTLLTTEHDPTACYGSQNHCFWHDVDEPGDAYRVCFECRHAFMAEAELLAEHNKQLARYPELSPETDIAQVFCCPFCIHDW